MNNHRQPFPKPFILSSKPNTEDAADKGMTSETSHLFEELYDAFWSPFYGYLRSEGYSHHDAEDLVQGLFAHLIENGVSDGLGCTDAKYGTCRHSRCFSYLFSCLRNYLCNERDRTQTFRRGGHFTFVSWEDDPDGDAMRYAAPRVPTPIDHLEEKWTLTLINRSITTLRAEVADSLKPGFIESLEGYFLGDMPRGNYVTLAARWGLSEPALRMTVSRLRRRFAQILMAALAADGYAVHSNGHHWISESEPRQSSSAVHSRQNKPVKVAVGEAHA